MTQKATETEVKAKKAGTIKTETILGKAAAATKSMLNQLETGMGAFKEMAGHSDDLTLKIVAQEEKISALDGEYLEKKRAGEASLQADLLENKAKVVSDLLAAKGMEAVNIADYTQLKTDYTNLKADFKTEVAREVAAAMNMAKRTFDSDKAIYIAEQSSKEADNKAKVANLEDKVSFLTDQNQKLLEQLDKAGDRAVEIAQAGSVGTINVGDSSKR